MDVAGHRFLKNQSNNENQLGCRYGCISKKLHYKMQGPQTMKRFGSMSID